MSALHAIAQSPVLVACIIVMAITIGLTAIDAMFDEK